MSENTKNDGEAQNLSNEAFLSEENKMAAKQKSLAIADKFDQELNPLTAFEPTASDIKTSDGPIKTVGFIVILAVFVLLGGWSSLAPIDSAALASGTVKVENNRKTVQHLEGGIVKAINVRDGDKVSKGDILLVIDQTQALAELSILKNQLAISQAVQSRLEAERGNKEAIEFPFVEVNNVKISQVMLSENELFQARRKSLKGEVSLLEKKISQFENRIEGLKSLIANTALLIKSFKREIRDNKALLSEGFVNKQRLVDVQRSKDRSEGESLENESNIAGLRVQIEETRLQILQLSNEFHREVASKLSEAQSQTFDLEERISAIADKVERTNVIAPSDGMVLGLKIHTVGGVLSPGTPILDIVPKGEALIVEAEVSTTDIDQISLNMAADIRFSSFKSGITPVIDGRVINISADSLVNENSGMSFYLAQLEITTEGMEKLGGLQLLPGMPAEVLINTGSRTVLEYLLQPATDAIARSMIEE
jgi:epimerase transport system membrane fusion protein